MDVTEEDRDGNYLAGGWEKRLYLGAWHGDGMESDGAGAVDLRSVPSISLGDTTKLTCN